MDPTERLSVVTVSFNSAAIIGDTLRAVASVLPSAEIIVVDNGSTDETLEEVSRAAPTAQVVSGHGNVGFATGSNLGAEVADREAILFLNPDTTPLSVDADPLGALLSREPLGLVGFSLGYPDGRRPEPALLRERTWVKELTFTLARAFLLPRSAHVRNRQARTPGEAWVSGAACIVRRTEFREQIGGFDERFFLYYEDWDLARRYRAASLPVSSSAALSLEHARRMSTVDIPSVTRVVWGLLGLTQWTANWEGASAASRVARSSLMFLVVIDRLFNLVPSTWPGGVKAKRKSRDARTAFAKLRSEASELHRDAKPAYPDARYAFRVALPGGVNAARHEEP